MCFRNVLAVCLVVCLVPQASHSALGNNYQATGNLGLEVTGVAGGNATTSMGTLTLTNLPPTAIIQRATLYAADTNNPNGLDAVFAGNNLGAGGFVADVQLLGLYSYFWDVTSNVVGGQNSYTFVIGQNTQGNTIAGVALAVVWMDPAEPTRTVSIFDGMVQVGDVPNETESVTFTQLFPGTTTAWLFTVYDDNNATGETITYNGNSIGGPIDRNLGFDASLFQISTTSLSGNNTLSITTGQDLMGWMVAAVAVNQPPVPAESSSWSRVKSLFGR